MVAYENGACGRARVNATVTIAQDGVAIAEGLTGEDTYTWGVTRNGTYVITHTTYTNGVAGAVETATFVVTGIGCAVCAGRRYGDGLLGEVRWRGTWDCG